MQVTFMRDIVFIELAKYKKEETNTIESGRMKTVALFY